MSLASYTDLGIAVASWLARPGDTSITANVADFIALCEARLAYGADEGTLFPSRPLRIRAMEASRTIPIRALSSGGTVGGTATAITLTPSPANSAYALGQTWSFTATASSTGATTANISGLGTRNILKGSALSALASNDIISGATVQLYDDGTELVLMPGTANAPLPTNYLAMRDFYLDTNPRTTLDYETPSQADLTFSSGWPATPKRYTIESDAIRFDPTPDTAYNAQCLYYQKFGALSSATNWLMTNAPNVYLYGSLLEAAIFIDAGPSERVTFFGQSFVAACNGLQSQDERDRHSGVLQIRNATGNY